MKTKGRRAVRGKRDQLMTLVNGWDPAGLIATGAPRNQYASIVDKLLSLLSPQVTAPEVARFLESEISAEFGSSPPGAEHFAKKAVNWFQIASAEE